MRAPRTWDEFMGAVRRVGRHGLASGFMEVQTSAGVLELEVDYAWELPLLAVWGTQDDSLMVYITTIIGSRSTFRWLELEESTPADAWKMLKTVMVTHAD